MHANYIYLMDGNDVDVENPSDLVINWGYSYENITDENNWYTPVAAFLRGQSYTYSEEKSGFEPTDELSTPEEWLKSAMIMAAYELNLFGASGFFIQTEEDKQVEAMSYDELLKAILTEVPNVLSDLYLKAVGNELNVKYDQENYRRMKMAKGYERLIRSYVAPFTTNGRPSPYDWRTVDLRNENNGDFNPETDAFLMMDIHT